MKFSRTTAFLTLLAIFFVFPLQSYAASDTHMPMAAAPKPSQTAQSSSQIPKGYKDGAFGLDLSGNGDLRLGYRHSGFDEVLLFEAARINPILYADGNNFSLNFEVYEINTGRHLITVSCPAPVYRFTNAGRNNEDFPYLSALFFRYAKYMYGLERNQPHRCVWSDIAEYIWAGSVPRNFKLDGNDTISFAGYPPTRVEYHELEHKAPTSIRAQQKEKEEAMKKTASDYINMCLPYAPLLITVKTDAGKLNFLYEKEKGYRLCELELNLREAWRFDLWGRELALFLLDNYSEIEDMEAMGNDFFYWKDINRNYVLAVYDTKVWMFPIVSENMLYPLHEGLPLKTNAALRKEYEEKHPTTTESRFVNVYGGVQQQIITRPLTFDEFLRGKIGEAEWEMGFRGFGDSLDF